MPIFTLAAGLRFVRAHPWSAEAAQTEHSCPDMLLERRSARALLGAPKRKRREFHKSRKGVKHTSSFKFLSLKGGGIISQSHGSVTSVHTVPSALEPFAFRSTQSQKHGVRSLPGRFLLTPLITRCASRITFTKESLSCVKRLITCNSCLLE